MLAGGRMEYESALRRGRRLPSRRPGVAFAAFTMANVGCDFEGRVSEVTGEPGDLGACFEGSFRDVWRMLAFVYVSGIVAGNNSKGAASVDG